jgi:hypothetical protein
MYQYLKERSTHVACLPTRCSGLRFGLCLQFFVSPMLDLMYVDILYYLLKLKITVVESLFVVFGRVCVLVCACRTVP